jgi:hypothetical protein
MITGYFDINDRKRTRWSHLFTHEGPDSGPSEAHGDAMPQYFSPEAYLEQLLANETTARTRLWWQTLLAYVEEIVVPFAQGTQTPEFAQSTDEILDCNLTDDFYVGHQCALVRGHPQAWEARRQRLLQREEDASVSLWRALEVYDSYATDPVFIKNLEEQQFP